MARGVFVAIVGPSGAGKDTLIGHARAKLGGNPGFVFVRRLVTRPTNAFEDHDTLDPEAFRQGVASGAFALSWRAHGLGYALPAETGEAISRGAVAICNLSRGVVADARERFRDVRVIKVTAPLPVLAQRLAARGRETLEAVSARLKREAERDDSLPADLTILNDRPIEQTGAELVDYLQQLSVGAAIDRP